MEMFAVLGLLCLTMVGALVAGILFLVSLGKTLDRCRRRNRTVEPSMVWLCLIPVFGVAWIFRIVFAVGDSLRNEYVDRDIDSRGDYGKTIGLCWLVTSLLGISVFFGSRLTHMRITLLGSVPFMIAALVLFVVYWVRIVGYRRQLERDSDRYDDPDFEDDDRPRRPSRLPSRPDDRIR